MPQTRAEAIAMIVSVLDDGQRSDRYLRRADDGHYYTTPDLTFLTADGRETPPYVEIPVNEAVEDDDQVMAWADALLDELDDIGD